MERSQKTQEKYVRKYAKQMKKRDLLHLGYGKGVIKRSILYRGKSLLSDSKIETINTKYRKKISEEETKKEREQNRRERKRENDRKYRERKRADKKRKAAEAQGTNCKDYKAVEAAPSLCNTKSYLDAKWFEWGFKLSSGNENNQSINKPQLSPNKIINPCKQSTINFAFQVGVEYPAPQKEHGFLIETLLGGIRHAMCMFCNTQFKINNPSVKYIVTDKWETKYCVLLDDEIHVLPVNEPILNIAEDLTLQRRTILMAPTTKSYRNSWQPSS